MLVSDRCSTLRKSNCSLSGNRHLGLTQETSPHARGFDYTFMFLSGCENRFNYEPQLDDPSHALFTPMNAGKFSMQDDKFFDQTNPKHAPRDFYSTTSFTDDSEQPFFAYLPFTIPHWQLHAPREIIEKYKGMYDEGPYKLREKRLERLIEIDFIKPDGELDNTFILFMSDNGADGAMLAAIPIMGDAGAVTKIIEKYYNNELDNMGMADSYIWYGAEWAHASSAPSRGYKTWITEGGIRCPCLIRYPPLHKANAKLVGGAITDSFSTVMDVLPTTLDLAGGSGQAARRQLVAHLSGMQEGFHDEEKEITGWGLFGERAIRQGPWKAVRMFPPRGKDKWEFYNVKEDPEELHDKAEQEKEVLEKLVRHLEVYYAETGMFDPGQEFEYTKYC
ncbi:alkaline phosphatase-like protein [Bimuria novae-zelandiae CBS 107.79]|uniref:Alkaline phosphatase-like protein n=1 Tax=Bimuria novae-zelandiae CBS 107.79 TaxID=1447943 RepID=A0A6A5UPI3_9PLEO|nr:alkaline phosphatase-like protein [Bimuria novae-zelandiae CBS 107.79]